MREGETRIAWLDGLRGVAILAVALWHYTNWGYAAYLPYRTLYAAIPVLDHGWIGVNLFFLISGYVILLTLQRCVGYRDFLARRWLRLFPAMLIASGAIFGLSRVLGAYMPHGTPPVVNLLPGLTFLIPTFWTELLGRPVDELDGVFWTLYVEMGFYLTFGALYFALGWRRGLLVLAAIWLAVIGGDRAAEAMGWGAVARVVGVAQWFGTAYFGWFVSGALFLAARQAGSRRLFAAALAAGAVSAVTSGLWQPDDRLSCLYLLACVALFAPAGAWPPLQRVLATRVLLFAGAISYPLYLLHNEIGIGVIGWAGTVLPPVLWPLLPFATLAAMIVAAWVAARWLEPGVRAMLRRAVSRQPGAAADPASRPPSSDSSAPVM